MKRTLDIVLIALTIAALLGLVLGYGGDLHPIGDSFAVFRAYAALSLAALGALLLVRRRWVAGAGSVLIGAGVFFSLGFVPLGNGGTANATAEASQTHTLYQKNLLFLNNARDELSTDILRRRPDVVTLQEVHKRNARIRNRLTRRMASATYCDFVGVGGVAVFSRWDMIEGTQKCLWGSAVMQVEAPEGPLWVISTHLHWVFPYENAEQVAELVPALAALDGPKVIGGDFNTVPWSDGFLDYARAAEVERIGRVEVSIVKAGGALRVPIDHVLVTGGQGRTELLPLLGSDHHGVWAEFSLPASGEE